ncbi:MAG: hypothetical protein HQL07_08745 [Nitrospirae bacterium]|nr:hypothetical protein [Magnetococcales bacterium]
MTPSIMNSPFKNWLYKDVQPYWAHRYLVALEGDDVKKKKLAIVGFLARIQVEESSGLSLIQDRTPGDRHAVFEKIHGLFGGAEDFKRKIGGESWTMAILEKKEELWRELEGARRKRMGVVWGAGALAGGIVIGSLLLILPQESPHEREALNTYILPAYSEKAAAKGFETARRKVEPVPLPAPADQSASSVPVPMASPPPSNKVGGGETTEAMGGGNAGVKADVAPLPEVKMEPVMPVPAAGSQVKGSEKEMASIGQPEGSAVVQPMVVPPPGVESDKDHPRVVGKEDDSSEEVSKPLHVESLGPLRVEPVKANVDALRVEGEVFEGLPGEEPFKPTTVAIVRYWQAPYVAVPDSRGGVDVGLSVYAPDAHHIQFSIADILGRTVSYEGDEFVVSRENLGELGLFFQIVPREAILVLFDSRGVATIPESFWSRLVKADGKWVTVSRIIHKSAGGSLHIRDLASQTIADIQADLTGAGVKK